MNWLQRVACALFGVLGLVSCGGIAEMDIPVYQREAAMLRLAKGEMREASDLLLLSLDKLDRKTSITEEAKGWAGASLTDARSLPYHADDYEVTLMLAMRAVANLGDRGKNVGDLHQAEQRQDDLFAQYTGDEYANVPAENRITKNNYQFVSFPYYLEAALEESNPLGGRDNAKKAYQKVLEIQRAQRSDCPLAAEMIARFDGGRTFNRDGAVHVVGFLGRGPIKKEETSVIAPVLISAVSVIVSVWGFGEIGGSDISLVPLPYPELFPRERAVAAFGVSVPDGSRARSAIVSDVTAVAKAQFEARRPWIIAQALIPRLVKTVALKAGETAALSAQSDYRYKLLTKLGFFIGKLLWEYSERADTRCWLLLPDMIHAARLDLPEGKHTLKVHALDGASNAYSERDVEVEVVKGRNTFVFVFFPTLQTEPSILKGYEPL
jgi:hypothetical protein